MSDLARRFSSPKRLTEPQQMNISLHLVRSNGGHEVTSIGTSEIRTQRQKEICVNPEAYKQSGAVTASLNRGVYVLG